MNNIDLANGMYRYGREQALDLRGRAPDMTGTEIIEEEAFVPEWRAGAQTLNALVKRSEIDQVYRVLQAHDSTATPDWTPETQPALFGVVHTTNPEQAKPWAEPQGTSGLYYKDECYRGEDGLVYQQTYDGGNPYDAVATPDRWTVVA